MNVDAAVYQARILIVDDQEANVLLLERLLSRSGFTTVVSTTDSACAVELCNEHDPDIVLLDLQMPAPDGFAIMDLLAERMSGPERLPVLILTADPSSDSRRRALAMGASDFLSKPFDATETLLRIRNLLLTHLLQRELQRQNASLEQRVRTRTRQLDEARIEAVERLARAVEYRDDSTGQHTRRVGQTAALIAQQLGLAEELVERIRRAAPLHDVGKIGIPDAILLKPGKLTPAEFDAMKQHTRIGAEILGQNRSKLMRLSEEIALTHHEHWDGGGYPDGLAGEGIPTSGRIVAVADVFDALTHKRPYKPAWTVADSVHEMQRLAGIQFDPAVIDAFNQLDPNELACHTPFDTPVATPHLRAVGSA